MNAVVSQELLCYKEALFVLMNRFFIRDVLIPEWSNVEIPELSVVANCLLPTFLMSDA